ncbi:MAG: hypothetical protein JO360_04120 [Acidobacteria bacterium]|nr:hypothetical protein [Acidobacteriota bacterium]
MKKFVAVLLMTLVLGVGAPAVFAEGPQETPGICGTQESGKDEGPQETPGKTDGPQETPGRVILEVLIDLATHLVA